MVFLGTVSVRPNVHYVHYMNVPELPLESFQAGEGILLPRKALFQGQVLDVSNQVPVGDRFVKLLDHRKNNDIIPAGPKEFPNDVCLRYMGAIGGKLRRKGEWFTETGDITTLRLKMKKACPRDSELVQKVGKKKKYKLVLYQRDKTR